jgi:hypothetical protein
MDGLLLIVAICHYGTRIVHQNRALAAMTYQSRYISLAD